MSVRTTYGKLGEFLVNIGLHQGSTLSSDVFTLIIEELNAHIQEDVRWYM